MIRSFKLLILVIFYATVGLNAQVSEVYIPYRIGDKWGISDTEKNIIVKPRFDKIQFFSEGFFQVTKDGALGLVDIKDEQILDCKYEVINVFKNNITVQKNQEVRLLDRNGNDILKKSFQHIGIQGDRKDLVTITTKDKNVGLIRLNSAHDALAEVLLDTIYGSVGFSYSNGNIIGFSKDYSTEFEFSISGNKLTKIREEAMEEGEIEFVDNTIEEETDPDNLNYTNFALLSYAKDGKFYPVIKKEAFQNGTSRSEIYDTLKTAFKNIRIIKNFNHWSKFKTKRDSVLWSLYRAKLVNLAIVTDKNDQVGLLNGDGEFLIPCQYNEMSSLPYRANKTLYFKAVKNKKSGIVDIDNQIVVPIEMDLFSDSKKYGVYEFQKNGLNGVLSDIDYCPPIYAETIKSVRYINEYFLVELINPEGVTLGFANQDGSKFFEE